MLKEELRAVIRPEALKFFDNNKVLVDAVVSYLVDTEPKGQGRDGDIREEDLREISYGTLARNAEHLEGVMHRVRCFLNSKAKEDFDERQKILNERGRVKPDPSR